MAEEDISSINKITVKELILDEQKIVTYISLSKDLCIHANEAKRLLSQVVDEIKGENSSTHLNVCFLISGLYGNNSARTTVCPESDIEVQRKSFKTVFFQHIYSVSLGSSCIDSAAFASVNKFDDFPLCAGLIKSDLCTKRSSDEIGTLKSKSQKIVDAKLSVVPPKKEIVQNTKSVIQNGHKDNKVVKIHETKSEPSIKSELTSPKKAASSSSNGKTSAKNEIKPSKGIAGFFNKSTSAPATKSNKANKDTVKEIVSKTKTEFDVRKETQPEEKKEIQPKPKKEPQLKVKQETQAEVKKEIQEECMDIDEEIQLKKDPQSRKKHNSKKISNLNQIKKNAKVDKKRKRVLRVSDSESDEDNDPFADEKPLNHESDDEIPPTPTINTVKITSGILNPRKRRKIVDKTYTDEEGYILTRKEEVYESCSEEEVERIITESVQLKPEKENVEKHNKVKPEESPKEKKGKNTKKKMSPHQKGKQANIMNFFKKI